MNIFNSKPNYTLPEITPGVKNAWRLQHGEVYEIVVDDKTGYFRNLGIREIRGNTLHKLRGKDVLDTTMKTLKLLWLGGDREFLTDDEFSIAAFNQLEPFLEKKVKRLLPNIKF